MRQGRKYPKLQLTSITQISTLFNKMLCFNIESNRDLVFITTFNKLHFNKGVMRINKQQEITMIINYANHMKITSEHSK